MARPKGSKNKPKKKIEDTPEIDQGEAIGC